MLINLTPTVGERYMHVLTLQSSKVFHFELNPPVMLRYCDLVSSRVTWDPENVGSVDPAVFKTPVKPLPDESCKFKTNIGLAGMLIIPIGPTALAAPASPLARPAGPVTPHNSD
jgi:hypothetical protein